MGKITSPPPMMIVCPYCGGWASDVSGIQKVPGGGYVKLPGEYMYFANLEGRDCGVPMLREVGIAKSGAKILIADELDALNRDPCSRQVTDELLEDMRKRTEEYIDAVMAEATKEALAEADAETQSLMEAARILAEQCTYSVEEVVGALMDALAGFGVYLGPEEEKGEFLNIKTAWDRKEAREKLQAVERENAARFRQYRARESTWAARKRTGQRRREWRGPWREKNN